MSEYSVIKAFQLDARGCDSPYWLIKSGDGRAVVGLDLEGEANLTANALNEETAALRAELDAAKLKIVRLREAIDKAKTHAKKEIEAAKDVILHTDSDGVYRTATARKAALEKVYIILDANTPIPSTDATDVTPDDDTQKLPELVACPDCVEGVTLIDDKPMLCLYCKGTGMVEKLPFAHEDALEQAPTPEPKFKVGDKVKEWVGAVRIGTISHIVTRQMYEQFFSYKVDWDNGHESIFDHYEHELVYADD